VVPPSQQLDLSSMSVEDDYQGPRLEGGHLVIHTPALRTGSPCTQQWLAVAPTAAAATLQTGRVHVPSWSYDDLQTTAGSPTEGYRITQQFVDSMLEAFREQKKISVRFAFEIVMGALAALRAEATLVDVDVPSGVLSVWWLPAYACHQLTALSRGADRSVTSDVLPSLHHCRGVAHSVW
jgi:PPP5 TPR repeat region